MFEAAPVSKTDKLERLSTPDERGDLKAATRRSIKAVRGNKFALVTRVEAEALSNYGSIAPECADKFMPVDVLADLQHEYGRGVASPLLEALAELAGFKLVPIESDDGGDGLALDDVSRMIKEGGEAKSAALGAVGATSLEVVRNARKEIREAKAVYADGDRKLARQERRLLARAG